MGWRRLTAMIVQPAPTQSTRRLHTEMHTTTPFCRFCPEEQGFRTDAGSPHRTPRSRASRARDPVDMPSRLSNQSPELSDQQLHRSCRPCAVRDHLLPVRVTDVPREGACTDALADRIHRDGQPLVLRNAAGESSPPPPVYGSFLPGRAFLIPDRRVRRNRPSDGLALDLYHLRDRSHPSVQAVVSPSLTSNPVGPHDHPF